MSTASTRDNIPTKYITMAKNLFRKGVRETARKVKKGVTEFLNAENEGPQGDGHWKPSGKPAASEYAERLHSAR